MSASLLFKALAKLFRKKVSKERNLKVRKENWQEKAFEYFFKNRFDNKSPARPKNISGI